MRILIAGIGNIFFGDDAFGVEVVRQLQGRALPKGVQAVDYGIRSYDLAYGITDGYDAVIFVDAAPRGGKPGTLYVMELDGANLPVSELAVNGHSLNPVAVLQMVRSCGAKVGRMYLVGCEPATLECEEGRMGLSRKVAATMGQAKKLILSLVHDLQRQNLESRPDTGLMAAA
jgi:hydrogenase maturation protease